MIGEHPGQSPAIRVYRGSDELDAHRVARGFTDFQAHMRMVFPGVGSLDKLLENQIDKARKSGTDVVVADLGAGTGNFARQALDEPAVLLSSRKRLAGRTCQTLLKFYSVTDSPTEQDHLRMTPFPESDSPGNEQIPAHEVNYSITSSQTIKKLFEVLQEQSADLIVASSFMTYLRPQVFRRTLQDIVDVLKPGGQFMAFGYATLAGRYLSIDDGYAETDGPVEFPNPDNPDGTRVTGDALRAWGSAFLAGGETTDEQLKAAIDSLWDSMYASDYYAQPGLENFNRVTRKSVRDRLAHGEPPNMVLSHLLDKILPIVEDGERVETMKVIKDTSIDDLAQKNAADAVIEYKRIQIREIAHDGILIRKRVSRRIK